MKIFISYRRRDSTHPAHRVRMSLEREFGPEAVFIDREIQAGQNWEERLHAMLASSTGVVVMVGDEFLREIRKRRVDDEDRLVWEIATAMRLGKPVYPVLFGRTDMPSAGELPESIRGFAKQQAVFAREPAFEPGVVKLVEAIRADHGLMDARPLPPASPLAAATPVTRIALNTFIVMMLVFAATWFAGALLGMLGGLPVLDGQALERPFWRGARYVLCTLLLGLGPYVSYYLVAVLRARSLLPIHKFSGWLAVLNVCGVLVAGGLFLLMSTIPDWRLKPQWGFPQQPTPMHYGLLALGLLSIASLAVGIAVWEPRVRTMEGLHRTLGAFSVNSAGIALATLVAGFAFSLARSFPPLDGIDRIALLGYLLLCPTLSLLYFFGWRYGRQELKPAERGWEFTFLFLLVLSLYLLCTLALHAYGMAPLFGDS